MALRSNDRMHIGYIGLICAIFYILLVGIRVIFLSFPRSQSFGVRLEQFWERAYTKLCISQPLALTSLPPLASLLDFNYYLLLSLHTKIGTKCIRFYAAVQNVL